VNPQYNIAVYGTLMSGHFRSEAALSPYAELQGPCVIRGDLYAVGFGAFPALRKGTGEVKGELWRALSLEHLTEMLKMTDSIEGYRANDEGRSMYLRRMVQLVEPDVTAWTYVWNSDGMRLHPIPSGDWREYAARERDAWRGTWSAA